MHDELKLEALDDLLAQILSEGVDDLPDDEKVVIQVGKRCTAYSELGEWRRAWAALRTLPPANTEADVERVVERMWDALARVTAMGKFDRSIIVSHDQFVEAVAPVLSALSLTRPAGGEEVEQALRVVLARHGCPCAGCELARSALTRPPALPKEGEDWQRDHVAPYDTPVVVKWGWDAELRERLAVRLTLGLGVDGWFEYPGGALDRPTHWKRDPTLSSLPVRSGEVERLREIVETLATFDARNSIVHLRDLARAALATPQQAQEGDSHG